MKNQTIVAQFLETKDFKLAWNILLCGLGVVGLAALAQITIHIPGTPVPITGQTFGATLLALTYGQRRGLIAFMGYLALGALHVPVFASGLSGLSLGPTSGYLCGMAVAVYVVGGLADRGWTQSFGRCWSAAVLGSALTFGFGILVLSYFVPGQSLMSAGVWPFLPGDVVKNLLAAATAYQISKYK